MKAIITGVAGFIGFHIAQKMLNNGWHILGVDNLNDYYDVSLKNTRLNLLQKFQTFQFVKTDIADEVLLHDAFLKMYDADIIIHMAAQAGVRYSLENPAAYIRSNVLGQVVLFEQALKMPKKPAIVYASSSSVYGGNQKVPFSEDDRVENPVSVYAATKRSGELLAQSYRHNYGLKTTGLRFFTVYGPFGRPDMAPWLFTKAILAGEKIKLFNYGNMQRDFTYIDDIVFGILAAVRRIIEKPEDTAPIYNLGNNQPIALLDFVKSIENALGKEALTELYPMPKADVVKTFADIHLAEKHLGFMPKTTIYDGMNAFCTWFEEYTKHNGKE